MLNAMSKEADSYQYGSRALHSAIERNKLLNPDRKGIQRPCGM